MVNYKNISVAASILYLVLFLVLLMNPNLVFWIFDIEPSEAARFISRRASFLFFGLAIISWLGREAEHSTLRQAVAMGMSTMMAALAVLGLFEFLRGYAGAGILLAISAEIFFAVAYMKIWLKQL
jgi:hypothetical protein